MCEDVSVTLTACVCACMRGFVGLCVCVCSKDFPSVLARVETRYESLEHLTAVHRNICHSFVH